MSENCDSDYQSGGKKKLINKDYKRKRTTMKEAKQEGKMTIECEFCPPNKRKIYLSYPALYFHVNGKHKGCKVTSAKAKEKAKSSNQTAPVLKMKTMLKPSDPERELIQRELLDIKLYLCYKLGQNFLTEKLTKFQKIGQKESVNFVDNVREKSLKLALELRLRRDFFIQAQKGEIFRQYFTKIAVISFGKDIVLYFAKSEELSHKIYLYLILMECLDQSLIDKTQFRDFEQQLWGQHLGLVAPIKEYWLKWRAINKEILLEESNLEQQIEQS